MNEKTPKLIHVTRLDSFPAFRATYTEEGYLEDKPILTSTGIFEYKNDDGSVRRELRLPEDVFDPESLASYKGKPIVITHDAGLIDTENVAENQIGTILTEGQKDGNNVRAEIVIHDTDALKQCHYKELSLGYNLDLEETPGEWNGQPYDAIQRNIRVNHLAVVEEARAGDQARLNIDGRANKTILTGGKKTMAKKKTAPSTRNDSILKPAELQKAIAEYKARRAATKTDEDEEAKAEELAAQEVVKPQEDVPAPVVDNPEPEKKEEVEKKDSEPEQKPELKEAPALPDQSKPLDEKLNAVKNRRDLRDEKGDPEDMDGAMEQIAEQDEDIDFLHNLIDTLLAERDFNGNAKPENTDSDDDEIPNTTETEVEGEPEDNDHDEANEDSADEDIPDMTEEEAEDCGDKGNFDDDEEEDPLDDDEFEEDEDEDTGSPAPFPPKAEEEEDLVEDEDDEEEEEEFEEDGDDDCIPSRMNQDSIDAIVQKQLRKRMEIAKIGSKLNLDGLEYQPIPTAKKKIIKKVRPGIRLDGKSEAYIDALYRLCVDDVKKATKKDTAYQRRQIMGKAYNADSRTENDSAESHRDGMIRKENSRRNNGKDKK